MTELTSDNVVSVLKDCLAEDESLKDDPNYLVVEGILHDYLFNRKTLESHRTDVASWIDQLPDEFRKDGGGGWSFLNLCMRKDGMQWTGFHVMQERFLCLAIGLGLAEIQLPRELWSVLPGGMPYVVFNRELERSNTDG